MPDFHSDLVRQLDQDPKTLNIIGPFLDAVKGDDLLPANVNWHDDMLISLEWWGHGHVLTLNIYTQSKYVLYNERRGAITSCEKFDNVQAARAALRVALKAL